MKALHISDLHLGRTTGRESRAIDHDAVIAEIIEYARELRPDVIVNSGDLFDRSRPGSDDLERAINAMIELAAIAPVVTVAGNHDRAALFRTFDRLSRRHGFYLISEPTIDPGHVIELPAAAGGTVHVGAVPFQHPNRMVDGRGDPDDWGREYAAAVRDLDAAVVAAIRHRQDPRTDFAVFAAHAYIGGATWSGTERRSRHDDIYATDADTIPRVAYGAYGHIHEPQPLPGRAGEFGRYAGSPLQLDFGEAGQPKSMVYVEATPGRPPRMEEIPLHCGRQLRTFQGKLDDLAAQAGDFGRDICQVIIDSDTAIPHLFDQVRDLLPHAYLADVQNNAADRRVRIVTTDHRDLDAPEPTIADLFTTHLATIGTTTAPAAAVLDVFHQILTAAEAGEAVRFPGEDSLDGAA
jgi:DNA repair protein SbcD/Mre11